MARGYQESSHSHTMNVGADHSCHVGEEQSSKGFFLKLVV